MSKTITTMIADNRRIVLLILNKGNAITVRNPEIDEILPYYEKSVLWFAIYRGNEIRARINSNYVEEMVYEEDK